MKPSLTNSAPVGPIARPRGSLSSAVGPVGGQPVGEIGPIAPRAAHDDADVARADGGAVEGTRGGRRQQHGLVAAVGHQEVARAVEGDGHRVPQLRRAQRAALPGRAADTGAGHGEEVPGRHGLPEERGAGGGQDAHPAVGGVGDEEVAGRVDRHPGRLVELARRGRRARRR